MKTNNANKKQDVNRESDDLDQLVKLAIGMAEAALPGKNGFVNQNGYDDSQVLITNAHSDATKDFSMYFSSAATAHVFNHTVAQPLNSQNELSIFYKVATDTCCAFASTCGKEW